MPSYAKNFEILIAAITYMGMHKWALRQPKGLAQELQLDSFEVKSVLDEFKGLFRKSAGKSKDHGEPFYSLHLRHARQEIAEDDRDRPPLRLDELMTLLDFVSKKAAEEKQRSVTITTTLIASGLSLFASIAALVSTFIR